jgi:PIN domain nuclease of toxin-antitoxin system
MTTYVLDASAVLRYVDDEAGVDRVEAIFDDCEMGRARACLSAIQWGEIAAKLRKRLGAGHEVSILGSVLPDGAAIIPADGEQALRAARLKVDRKIAYADAFALDVAMLSPDHLLVTADYGFKAVEDMARIEFLPVK